MEINNDLNILAMSSSRVGDSAYLEPGLELIKKLLGTSPCNIGFIPFASADRKYETYFQMVQQALGHLPYTITQVSEEDPAGALQHAHAIMTGGGNTFTLLQRLQQSGTLEIIAQKIRLGIPYIGWSAGSNILAPTICTTNDMPIIQPQSFEALNVLPFQINPHYTNRHLPGHRGETRDDRLNEYCLVNRGKPVIAIPEGSALFCKAGQIELSGAEQSYIFLGGENGVTKKLLLPGDLMQQVTRCMAL